MSQTQELHNYKHFGISDIGNIRKENEDKFTYIESINGSFFILCDGMGGVKGGEIAANITIESISHFVSENWFENPIELISKVISIANTDVYQYFKNDKAILKAGTTLVLVLIRNNKIYYAHVGDSRIYYKTGKKLFQITSDHSYVQNLVDQNIITEDEAKEHTRKNEITKAIGTKKTVEPTICSSPIIPSDNDSILLCSDGLTNELSRKEILSILQNNKLSINQKGEQLITNSLENGGHDNITLQLITFYNTGKSKSTYNTPNKNRNKYKHFFFITLLLVLSFILFFIILKKTNKIYKPNNYVNKQNSSLVFYKKHKKDTIINIYAKNSQNLQTILTSYNLTKDKIGQATSLVKDFAYVKYYIPVNVVYKYQVGKDIFSYPEINKQNIIDIIIVNNKKELYFKPGENIIVP